MLAITHQDLLLSGIGYLIVFLVLLMLYLVFEHLPKLLGSITYVSQEAIKMRDSWMQTGELTAKPGKEVLTGETCAAIATALHLHLYEAHDGEEMRLTINNISRSYSPWSSKIYGVQNRPLR